MPPISADQAVQKALAHEARAEEAKTKQQERYDNLVAACRANLDRDNHLGRIISYVDQKIESAANDGAYHCYFDKLDTTSAADTHKALLQAKRELWAKVVDHLRGNGFKVQYEIDNDAEYERSGGLTGEGQPLESKPPENYWLTLTAFWHKVDS